ncbi:hypothetical protein GYMLUDRAFT_226369 [Collybiopsis luxurians FD-317 M1]|uniref:Cytochrome P450 n=1 Tax=Collybiopsis luxurians FD-317 M1 TaxID=944289 RepID=A0A0D0CC47_9AGAR|nr:hypothetical protein GYMLUDRAFT_226369 [Collybiopsis luxurians FD-317 M1]
MLVICTIIIAYFFYKATKRSPLWHIPGPKSNSFILGNLCELYQTPTGSTEFEWQETYGGIVRFKGSFGSDQLMITDPKALQHIFQGTDYKWRKSSTRREYARLISGRGLTWADGDVHKRQRKIMLPGFSAPAAKNLLPFFASCAANLCSRWADIISTSSQQFEVLNIPEWTSRATLDVIGQTLFDYDFEAISNEHNELVKHYRSLMAKIFGNPSKASLLMLELFKYFPPWFMEFMNDRNPRFAPLHRLSQVATNTAKKLVTNKFDELREGKNKKDIMTLLVQANTDVSHNIKSRLSEEELLACMQALMFAGHETTANTLTWMLYELARSPRLQERLRAEIRCTEQRIMSRRDAEITIQDLESMPLLGAVVKETLRFHTVSINMGRTSVEDDILPLSKPITTKTGEILQEIPLPKGTTIYASISAYNRNKDIFGDDACMFNADRWLESGHVATGVCSMGVYANLATFSAGVRSCVGWRFAVLELQTFLFELIRSFEFTTTPALNDIQRMSAFVMIPSVRGELSQMPLRVASAPKDDEY